MGTGEGEKEGNPNPPENFSISGSPIPGSHSLSKCGAESCVQTPVPL